MRRPSRVRSEALGFSWEGVAQEAVGGFGTGTVVGFGW